MNYQITLWEEIPQGDSSTNEYIKENCLCILSSSDEKNIALISDPIFKEEINGQRTLTFTANYKYYDVATQDYIDNPCIDYLKNGRIVKLKINDDFNSFIITSVEKTSNKKTLLCTCSDLNIYELSKTGFNIELNTELENNMGNIFTLANKAITNTNWHIIDDNEITASRGNTLKSDIIQSYRNEALYPCTLTENLIAIDLSKTPHTSTEIPSGDVIYLSQTSYTNADGKIYFLWRHDNSFEKNNKRVVINSDIYTATVSWSPWPSLTASASFIGRMLQETSVTKYITEIDKTCKQYLKGSQLCYGFNEVKFASSVDIQNLISNNTNYVSTTDWSPVELILDTTSGDVVQNQLKLKFTTNGTVINNGFNDSKSAFKTTKGFNAESNFVVALKPTSTYIETEIEQYHAKLNYRSNNCNTDTLLTTMYSGYFENKDKFESSHKVTIPDSLDGYVFAYLIYTGGSDLSYNEVLDSYLELSLIDNHNIKQDMIITDAKFFKFDTTTKNNITELIIPDLSILDEEVARDYTYIFRSNILNPSSEEYREITSENDLVFEWYGDSNKIPSIYVLVTNSNYELITSIEAKESNHFNIIQDLCEKFECWAKFYVDTNELGATRYKYQLTTDTDYISGKRYFTQLSGATGEDFDDIHYNYADLSPYFVSCSELSYIYSKRDRYYRKVNNTFVKANLGYQWNCGITFYKIEYSTETGSTKTSKTYVVASGDYSSNTQYYLKNTATSNYTPVVVTNEFNTAKSDYYFLTSDKASLSGEGWDAIRETLYEKYYKKYITFNEYTGEDNDAGFIYGINLNNIKRTLKSDNLVTKMIVTANSNQYAEDGFCDISTASQNASGSNTLYNFDYYIDMGLIDEAQFNRDMYGVDANDLAYMTKYIKINAANTEAISRIAALKTTVTEISAQQTTYTNYVSQAQTDYSNYVNDIYNIAQTLGKSWTYDYCKTVKRDTKNYPDKLNEYIDSRDTATLNITNYSAYQQNLTKELENYNARLLKIEKQQDSIANYKTALDYEFYQKYSRYIHEGTWTSEDYYDADTYYQDACEVLVQSAFPTVEYTFEVVDLSDLKKWSGYKFRVGDKTYVYDKDFFGDQKTPQMEVIISEISWNLDIPSKTSITVQNYATQFQDLFQRIAAATQSLEYNKSAYNYAASVTNNSDTGGKFIKEKLEKNVNLISAVNGTLEIDTTNGTITTKSNSNKYQVAITPAGILIADPDRKNEENLWTTAISGKGINADKIASGEIHADKVNIYGGSKNALFNWDKYGITAFTGETGIVTYLNKFVRFDKNGIYGLNGESYDQEYSASEIADKALFSLTWDGLSLRSNPNSTSSVDNYLKLDANGITIDGETKKGIIVGGDLDGNNFYILEDGTLFAKKGKFSGQLEGATGKFNGVVQASDFLNSAGQSVMTNGRINANYLNLGGVVIDGSSSESGARITINSGAIRLEDGSHTNYVEITEEGISIHGGTKTDVEEILDTKYNITYTSLNYAYIKSPQIVAGKFITSGGDITMRIDNTGFNIGDSIDETISTYNSIGQLGYDIDEEGYKWAYPYLRLGLGSNSKGTDALVLKKFAASYWLGSAGTEVTYGNLPGSSKGGYTTPPAILSDTTLQGLLIWLGAEGVDPALYQVTNGVTTKIGAARFS